jgi:hypothetical protein
MELPPIPIAMPSEEIKKVIGKTTVTAAMAKEPIHCPTKMVSTKILTDMKRIPIEAGTACLINNCLMSSEPNAPEERAIYALV